jgi:hypothetical protein
MIFTEELRMIRRLSLIYFFSLLSLLLFISYFSQKANASETFTVMPSKKSSLFKCLPSLRELTQLAFPRFGGYNKESAEKIKYMLDTLVESSMFPLGFRTLEVNHKKNKWPNITLKKALGEYQYDITIKTVDLNLPRPKKGVEIIIVANSHDVKKRKEFPEIVIHQKLWEEPLNHNQKQLNNVILSILGSTSPPGEEKIIELSGLLSFPDRGLINQVHAQVLAKVKSHKISEMIPRLNQTFKSGRLKASIKSIQETDFNLATSSNTLPQRTFMENSNSELEIIGETIGVKVDISLKDNSPLSNQLLKLFSMNKTTNNRDIYTFHFFSNSKMAQETNLLTDLSRFSESFLDNYYSSQDTMTGVQIFISRNGEEEFIRIQLKDLNLQGHPLYYTFTQSVNQLTDLGRPQYLSVLLFTILKMSDDKKLNLAEKSTKFDSIVVDTDEFLSYEELPIIKLIQQ